MVNDGDSLLYIERESSTYDIGIIDLEGKARNYLDYHDQNELRKWEYLNKIPKGMFER